MHRKQSGFTIVELVVVIILLGILAATALPRFINIDEQAHGASFESVTGTLQTGVSLFHAQWIAEGARQQDTQFPDFNNLRNNQFGYPYGTANRATDDVTNSADCAAIFTNVMQMGGPTVRTANTLAQVANRGIGFDYVAFSPAPGSCTFYYTADDPVAGNDVNTMTYDSSNGTIVAGQETLT